MRYLKINENLYLTQKEVKAREIMEEPKPTNHILIYDRSHSMHGLLKNLTEDIIARIKEISVGDTVSIGWFSTEGSYNFALKGFKISDDNDYTILENAIRNNNTTIGMTCFSEILKETADNVVQDLSLFSDRYSLVFFSDGYPIVSDYSKEIKNIFEAIKDLEKKLTSSLLVGYGNYYNKELLSKMAEKLGGSLVHSSNLESFNETLSSFIETTKGVDNKIEVEVDGKAHTYFNINGKTVNVYTPENDSILFSPPKRGKNFLYSVTEIKPSGTEVKLLSGEVGKSSKIEHFVKGTYSAAYLMVQKAKTNIALDILGKLGDKSLINSIMNAFTHEEFGKSEKRILDCVTSPNKRFLDGRDTNYLPKKDAFCALELIDLLCSDKEAYFYPSHKDFKYNRIGLPSVSKDGFPKFESNKENKCGFSNISWHGARLNLSVRTTLRGNVKLKKNYKKFGFDSNRYETFVWRNFTLVRDGVLNVTKLPVSFGKETFEILKQNNLVEGNYENKVYSLDISELPVMNRSISESNTSAEALFKMSYKELLYKAYLKTYKFLKNELEPEQKTAIIDDLTVEQSEYLEELGVTPKGFNPPTEKVESTDYYYAKEFKIAIKKYSSLPTIKKVRDKNIGSKNLTASEVLIDNALATFDSETGKLSEPYKIAWLNKAIDKTNSDVRELSSKIQRIKFAIILGNQWFDEFENREDCKMLLDDVNFEVVLKDDVKIEI